VQPCFEVSFISLAYSVDLVYLVCLVYLVSLVDYGLLVDSKLKSRKQKIDLKAKSGESSLASLFGSYGFILHVWFLLLKIHRPKTIGYEPNLLASAFEGDPCCLSQDLHVEPE
jgi:hypothetical protein